MRVQTAVIAGSSLLRNQASKPGHRLQVPSPASRLPKSAPSVGSATSLLGFLTHSGRNVSNGLVIEGHARTTGVPDSIASFPDSIAVAGPLRYCHVGSG
jgi:hypothetical protein